MSDHARLHEFFERPGGFGQWHGGVGPVHLVQIDVLDAQCLQTVLDTLS